MADAAAAQQHGHTHVGTVGEGDFHAQRGRPDLNVGLDHGAGLDVAV